MVRNFMDTNKIVDVMDISSYPDILTKYLDTFSDRFIKYNSIENRDFFYDFGDNALNLIKDYDIVAYHYTKEIHDGYFKKNGLQCLSFEEHKNQVIRIVENKLSAENMDKLQSLQCPNDVDNGKLHFVYTFDKADAGDLVRYFGGECIYGQITDGFCRNEISDVLESTGTPVVVKFRINIGSVNSCSAIDTIISKYAKHYYNEDFSVVRRQGFTAHNILPEQILQVIDIGLNNKLS